MRGEKMRPGLRDSLAGVAPGTEKTKKAWKEANLPPGEAVLDEQASAPYIAAEADRVPEAVLTEASEDLVRTRKAKETANAVTVEELKNAITDEKPPVRPMPAAEEPPVRQRKSA